MQASMDASIGWAIKRGRMPEVRGGAFWGDERGPGSGRITRVLLQQRTSEQVRVFATERMLSDRMIRSPREEPPDGTPDGGRGDLAARRTGPRPGAATQAVNVPGSYSGGGCCIFEGAGGAWRGRTGRGAKAEKRTGPNARAEPSRPDATESL